MTYTVLIAELHPMIQKFISNHNSFIDAKGTVYLPSGEWINRTKAIPCGNIELAANVFWYYVIDRGWITRQTADELADSGNPDISDLPANLRLRLDTWISHLL